MKPYFDKGGVTLWHGDSREIVRDIDPAAVSLVVTDPPYGVSERCDRKTKGRSNEADSIDFAPVVDDDKPFDPSHLLKFKRLVLFGGNYFADKLPTSSSWFVWDKRDGTTPDDNADCEVAWTNLGGPMRMFTHLWRGMIKASERDDKRVHPTQKPVALGVWIINGHSETGETILDPYAGSGAFLVAAWKLQRQAIGIEIEERYCEISAKRLEREMAQGDLFRRASP